MKTKQAFLILFLSVVLTGFSQKIDKQNVTFEYIQMPKQPLDKSIQNYYSQVTLAYEAEIIDEQQKVQEKYDMEMAEYPQKVKEAEERHKEVVAKYEADMVAWKEKSIGSKLIEKNILNENNKPVSPGTFYAPSKPYMTTVKHQKIFNKEMLANTYLNLDGYNKKEENALQIKVTLYGFENLEPELKSIEKSSYNSKTKQTTKVMTYWYEISYKHPINLTIKTEKGETIINETFEQFNNYSIAKTNVSEGSYPNFNKDAFIEGLQNKIVEENMKYIKEFINNNYGFVKMKRNTTVYRVEGKQLNYDDFQQAFELVTAGYNILISDNRSAKEKIGSAIQIWEKALLESDPEDKKARINSDITIITLLNLAEAYSWTHDYAKADECLNRIISLKPSKKEKNIINDYRILLKEQKERWEVNVK